MNCIILLLLLGCFGGFGCGTSGTSYVSNGGGSDSGTALGNGNNIRRGNSGTGGDCGCTDSGVAIANNGYVCDSDDGITTVSGGPSNWQDYPSIPGRESNCDCED